MAHINILQNNHTRTDIQELPVTVTLKADRGRVNSSDHGRRVVEFLQTSRIWMGIRGRNRGGRVSLGFMAKVRAEG